MCPARRPRRWAQAAREAGVYLAMGVIERDSQFSRGTLYCTLLYFGPDGRAAGQTPQAQADRLANA